MSVGSLVVGQQAEAGLSLPTPKMMYGKPGVRDQFLWVAKSLHEKMRLLHVKDIDEYYYQPDDSPLYERLQDSTLAKWVRDSWLSSFGAFSPKDIKDTSEVVKLMTDEETERVSSNYIYVCKGVYWDKQNGELTDSPVGPVFYKLFDTSFPDRHTVAVRPFTDGERMHLLQKYEQVKEQLHRNEYKCEYEFINVWANEDQEVAKDLIRMNAYCFLDKKPLGSGILVGLKRNGKSTYVDMLHTELGGNNTSRVQLSQLGDPHFTHQLRFSLMNAPDEEEDKSIQYQGIFKTMSDHGVLTLPVMRSNVPVRVQCDFMSFFPMNHTPEWTGSGASACVARSLIMPFENDLSKYDKTSKNFCEETFTAEMFSDYLGTVFAFAWWYHRHDHEFSNRMHAEQETIQEDLDSAVIYREEFERFFDGFENLKTVYEDYQYWCRARETRISTYKQFKFVFKNYMSRRTKYRGFRGAIHNVYRYVQPGKQPSQPLLNNYVSGEFGSIVGMHEKQTSMVERLIDRYAEELHLNTELSYMTPGEQDELLN